MKKVLSVLAIAALVLVSFTSCNPQEQSMTEKLTISKGWVLSAAESTPAYEMLDGTLVSNLFNGYLEEWEKEYITVFNANGSEIVKPGKVVAPSSELGYTEETSLGNWTFNEDETRIMMQVPFFMDEDIEICNIVRLTKDEFVVNCTINDDENPAKGTYTFTLTYVPAK